MAGIWQFYSRIMLGNEGNMGKFGGNFSSNHFINFHEQVVKCKVLEICPIDWCAIILEIHLENLEFRDTKSLQG